MYIYIYIHYTCSRFSDVYFLINWTNIPIISAPTWSILILPSCGASELKGLGIDRHLAGQRSAEDEMSLLGDVTYEVYLSIIISHLMWISKSYYRWDLSNSSSIKICYRWGWYLSSIAHIFWNHFTWHSSSMILYTLSSTLKLQAWLTALLPFWTKEDRYHHGGHGTLKDLLYCTTYMCACICRFCIYVYSCIYVYTCILTLYIYINAIKDIHMHIMCSYVQGIQWYLGASFWLTDVNAASGKSAATWMTWWFVYPLHVM